MTTIPHGILPGLTGVQADALAGFIATLRPGEYSWTKTKIYDALRDAGRDRTNDPVALTLAAMYCALSGARKPTVIAMPGAHWENANRARSPLPQGAVERKDPHCPNCGDMHGTGPCTPPAEHRADPAQHSTAAKQAIAAARAATQEAGRYQPPAEEQA